MHLLIYNPVSGKDGDELKYLIDLFIQYDISVEVLVTYDNKTISEFFLNAIISYECVIVAGGDGTISQAIDAIVLNDISTRFLIYPRGTTNEYASTMHIDKKTIIKYLSGNYNLQFMDIGVFNNKQCFTYSLIFGNFTHVTYETPQWLKNKIGYFAYWIYGFFNLYFLRIKRYEMKFMYDNTKVEGRFLFGSISNSKSLGKVIYLDDVSFSDGLLELFLVKAPSNIRDVIELLHDARTGENKSKLFIKEKITSLEVSSPKKHSWSADGEFIGVFDKLTIITKKKAIEVIW